MSSSVRSSASSTTASGLPRWGRSAKTSSWAKGRRRGAEGEGTGSSSRTGGEAAGHAPEEHRRRALHRAVPGPPAGHPRPGRRRPRDTDRGEPGRLVGTEGNLRSPVDDAEKGPAWLSRSPPRASVCGSAPPTGGPDAGARLILTVLISKVT